ncbi:uncharacterized protein M6B38_195215 [Iris pallida]|uniref:Zinc finger PHD-type domain-containing protein n=1 Tax=Iris pallida TaxID=29817 RepID=A0AAX6EEM3_IRIPA|nr:uncharacterized protein M6B38_195215 [Iris pallida]
MENCTKTQMGQICATCGNMGFAEQLVTCYECKKSSAHIYCMRDRLLNVPTVWYCEECLGAPADHIETEKTSKRQKIVIGTEKSNSILERSPLESSEVTRHVSDHEQQSWAKKSVSTILKTKVKSTACANSEALFRQGDGMSSPVSNISNSPSSIHFLYQKKIGPADADVHSSPSKYIKRMSEVGNEKAETPEKAKASGGAFHSNSEFIRTGLPEPNMPALVNQYEELLHCHSPQVSWKGTFEIFDVASHLYKKMRAHLPTAICPKVYESMKKLPKTLKFKLSSREDIWPKIFRLEPPTKNDIGLYFFPNELGRPKDKYLRLLERLKSRNLAMVSCMNDVQVLLFTSDELPVGSQRIDAEIYLWGLFRHVKHRKPSCKIKVESPSYNSSMDLRDNYCAEVNVPSRCSFEEVAMEVDMVGGKDVGRIDIPIARPTLPPCLLETNAKCLSYEERSVMKFSSEREAVPIHQEVPCGFSKLGLSSFPEEMSSKRQSGFLESSSKGCTPSEISIQNTCTPHCSLESNSRLLNSVERSAVQLSLEKVATPIIPDVPPGFSKLKPPSFSKEMCSKHQSGCLQSTSKACTTSRIDISIKSTSTPHCSPETSARELNSAERSAVQFSLEHRKPSCKIKVESPSYNSPMDSRDNDCAEVNVPSRCSFKEVAMEVDMVGGKDVGRIDIPIPRPTLPPCLLETNAKCLSYEERPVIKFSSEREAIPIHQEVPFGFSKLGPSSFPEEMSSKHQSGFLESSSKGCTPSDISIQNTCTPHCSLESNSRLLNSVERSAVQLSLEKVATPIIPDVPPGFSKLKPPSFSKEMCSKHQSGCLQSTSKACTTSRIDISIKSTSTPHCSPETSARELNSAERSAVQFSLEHRKPSCKIKVESPSYNSPMDSRDNDCAEVNVPSRCSFKEVAMEVDMVGGKDVGRIDIPIPRPTLPPCLLETNAKCLSYEERPVIKFSSEREAIPIHQEVPFGFSKLGPSSFPEEMSSKHQSGFLESSSKGCTPSDISIQNTCTPHCSLESNSRHLNSVERSAVQLSLEKVATPIIPDVPPGFSKLKPPSFSKEMCSKHQSVCLQSTSKACTTSRIDISIKSTSTPHCSPETSARDLDSAERSAVQFSLEKVPSPIPPDVPTAFLKLEPPSFPEQTTARDLNSVERSLVQLSCEKLASPIILDVPPGFSKLKPQIFSEELGSKYQSGSLESTFKDCTHSRDIPEENTYTSDLSPETNARDLNCEERSSVQFSLTKKAKASPILLDVPSCLSKVVPQDDLILWSSKHKNLSLESTSKSCIPSRIKLPIQRTYSSNGSAETNATDLNCVQRPLVKFSLVKLISPIRSEVPKCFLKAKPSGSSKLSSSLHRGSFLKSTSNACRPSRLHNGCNLSSSMEGVASDPNTPDMQSKHHKEQAPGYQNRSPMHIKSSHSSASAKAKKEVTLFSSPVRDTKLHSGSKNLPSPYGESK